jgi:hypothetical protein
MVILNKRYAIPRALASFSLIPTRANSGSVNRRKGTCLPVRSDRNQHAEQRLRLLLSGSQFQSDSAAGRQYRGLGLQLDQSVRISSTHQIAPKSIWLGRAQVADLGELITSLYSG